MNTLIADWQIKVSSKTEGVANDIIKYLAVNPYFTIKNVVENLGVAFTTAQRTIIKLEGLSIISQTSQGRRDRVYCAADILNILEEPNKITEILIVHYSIIF